MFTGIVQGLARVCSVQQKSGVLTFGLEFPAEGVSGVSQGASIAINGCCLTVTGVSGDLLSFDCVPETIARTTLGALVVGDAVNFERSLKFGDEVGGHILSGHIDVVGEISRIDTNGESKVVSVRFEPRWARYIFPKGYLAINGASLTLMNVDAPAGEFSISLIPETLSKTTFGSLEVGSRVNIEIDRSTQAIVDTVERVMRERLAA